MSMFKHNTRIGCPACGVTHAEYSCEERAAPDVDALTTGAVHRTAPFSNCKFRECDLPGQCRSEGKCHHPASEPKAAEDEPLTCDFCGAKVDDPWHTSDATRKHLHQCDACHASEPKAPTDVADSAVAKDAARYRWLRRQAVAVNNYATREIGWALRGESFEVAVDAAIAASAESKKSPEPQ
jgi:hypothetical protein